jgi:hypothetical protein
MIKNKLTQKVFETLVLECSNGCDEHPDAVIQSEWNLWLEEGPFTYERYKDFISWKELWIKNSKYFK